MRGEILLKALEAIERFAYFNADFAEAFAASTKSNYLPLKKFEPKYHRTLAETIREHLEERRKISDLIYRLQRDGLIVKSGNKKRAFFKITLKGKAKKKELKEVLSFRLPYNNYDIQRSSELIIVSFDIPEKERHKRNWLRWVLKNLGLRMLQKSVWIGKIKIPKEFINDLKKYNLLSCVEIFSVSKTGTIKHIA